MSSPTPRVGSSESLRRVTRALADAPCGAVIVTGPVGPVGVVTDNDVVLAIALGIDLDRIRAGDAMQPIPPLVRPEDAPTEVAEVMVRFGLHHVAVLHDEGGFHLASSFEVLRALRSMQDAGLSSGSAVSPRARS
jgi:CBS domain-containing protein